MTMGAAWPAALLVISMLLAGVAASAQEAEQDGTAQASQPFRLHIPQSMIAEEQYSGLIVMEEPAAGNIAIRLASTDDSVSIPDVVVVDAGMNHGMFLIVVGEDANPTVTMHAVAAGHISRASSQIITTSESGVSLRLVGPAPEHGQNIRTHVGPIPLYVYMTNNNGVPIPAAADTVVRLSASTTSIRFAGGPGLTGGTDEFFVNIPEGGYVAKMTATVEKTGTIYASADGTTEDSIHAEFVVDDTRLRLAVAPDDVGRNGYAYFFVWIERDGRQFIPADLSEVTLITSDVEVAGFWPGGMRGLGGSMHSMYMDGGAAVGTIYTGDAGTASITAFIPGIGTQTATLNVVDIFETTGTEATLEEIMQEYDQCSGGLLDRGGSIETCNFQTGVAGALLRSAGVNEIILEVYPDVPSERAWAVLSGRTTVQTVDTVTTVADIIEDTFGGPPPPGQAPEDPGEQETETLLVRGAALPATFSTRFAISLSGDAGLTHPDVIVPYEHDSVPPGAVDTHAVLLEMGIVNDGRHFMAVHSDEATGDSVDFTSRPQYGEGYPLHVMGLPAPQNVRAEIALVFVTDHDNNIIDMTELYSRSDRAHISQSGTAVFGLDGSIRVTDAVLSVHGTHTKKQVEVFSHLPGLTSEPTIIAPAGVPAGIRFWAPDTVHITEEFPVVIHSIDASGHPIGVLDRFDTTPRSVRGFSAGGQMFFSVGDVGETSITVITDDGFIDTRRIEAFQNNATGTVHISAPETDVEVGDNIILDIFTGPLLNPIIEVIGGLDFFPDDAGSYVAVPEERGTYEVIVRVGGDGWDTHEEVHTFDVSHFIDISLDVMTDDGVPIPVEASVSRISSDANGTAPTHILIDGISTTGTPGLYSISLPTEYAFGENHVYVLDRLRINDDDVPASGSFSYQFSGDAAISPTYTRHIEAVFVGEIDSEIESVLRGEEIAGSGEYGFGDIIVLEAPVIYEYGLIRHMPDRWTGLPGNAAVSGDKTVVEMEALESSYGTVSYVRDSTLLIGAVAAGIIAIPLALRRISPDLFADMPYMIRSMLKKMPGKPKMPKKPKVGGK